MAAYGLAVLSLGLALAGVTSIFLGFDDRSPALIPAGAVALGAAAVVLALAALLREVRGLRADMAGRVKVDAAALDSAGDDALVVTPLDATPPERPSAPFVAAAPVAAAPAPTADASGALAAVAAAVGAAVAAPSAFAARWSGGPKPVKPLETAEPVDDAPPVVAPASVAPLVAPTSVAPLVAPTSVAPLVAPTFAASPASATPASRFATPLDVETTRRVNPEKSRAPAPLSSLPPRADLEPSPVPPPPDETPDAAPEPDPETKAAAAAAPVTLDDEPLIPPPPDIDTILNDILARRDRDLPRQPREVVSSFPRRSLLSRPPRAPDASGELPPLRDDSDGGAADDKAADDGAAAEAISVAGEASVEEIAAPAMATVADEPALAPIRSHFAFADETIAPSLSREPELSDEEDRARSAALQAEADQALAEARAALDRPFPGGASFAARDEEASEPEPSESVTAASVAHDAAAPETPEPAAPEEDVAPAPAESEPARKVIRSFSSGPNRYTMYENGSIEADTPQGRLSFASFDELRRYIDDRMAAPRQAG